MTREEYLEIRGDEKRDILPLFHFLNNLEGKIKLTLPEFKKYFTLFIRRRGLLMLSRYQYNMFTKLDNHFKV